MHALRLPAFAALSLLASARLALADPGAAPAPKKVHALTTALPPAAARPADFAKDIKPLLEASCTKCHARGKDKGGFSIETREAFLKGGDTGPAALPGNSGKSFVVELVAALDPENIMPKKGTHWTAEQVGLLRAWIDQGMPWPAGISFAKPPPQNLHPRAVSLAASPDQHPLDALLASYFAAQKITPPSAIDDPVFARRAYLDAIGLLPSPEQLDAFLRDPAPDKRARLVRALLADKRNYADHWLTFWNDLLRNDYRGTGFIDGGRKQISGWLYSALLDNLPYDKFVAQLVAPAPRSEGFTSGILWRGNVNASMTPPMQAAQSVSQVFLGVNLKCASCHDSFINDWSLADAYGLAAIYSDSPLELVHCDKPTGKKAAARFLYPELGAIDAAAPRPERLARLAAIITAPGDGRISRTIVNRFWARLFGRGLVEPIDDMERPAWNRDLLDWLAEDLVAHRYDLKRTLEMILTSRAYQLPSVESAGEKDGYVFRGPLVRRMTAEQFCDALSALTGEWNRLPASLDFDFGLEGELRLPQWVWTDEPAQLGPDRTAARAAKRGLDTAALRLAEAQKKTELAAQKGGPAVAAARAAVEQTSASLAAARDLLAGATQPAEKPVPGEPAVVSETQRHKVVFRKKFTLPAVPAQAYAAILATQAFEVQVNGKPAAPIMRDATRNNRIALLDLKPLLAAGENVIAIGISSHTEKPSLNDPEKKAHPASLTHLNARSGLAFYARCEQPGANALELTTDATWRVRRAPDGAWNLANFADSDWAAAQPMTADAKPVDEGPGLLPLRRKDFANMPAELAPQLRAAVSTAAHAGQIRTALLAADPLQVALDRPNREVIVPVRATAATMLQALELTNGATLDSRLKKSAAKLAAAAQRDPAAWLQTIYQHALARPPTATERTLALELFPPAPQPEAVADFLWAIVNTPEFQLIR